VARACCGSPSRAALARRRPRQAIAADRSWWRLSTLAEERLEARRIAFATRHRLPRPVAAGREVSRVDAREEAHERVAFLKDVIENKGGHRLFYSGGQPIQRELDLQIAYRLVWYGSPSDVSTEVNDGRGPADFKVLRGAADKN
jgi:hypothetical protein